MIMPKILMDNISNFQKIYKLNTSNYYTILNKYYDEPLSILGRDIHSLNIISKNHCIVKAIIISGNMHENYLNMLKDEYDLLIKYMNSKYSMITNEYI